MKHVYCCRGFRKLGGLLLANGDGCNLHVEDAGLCLLWVSEFWMVAVPVTCRAVSSMGGLVDKTIIEDRLCCIGSEEGKESLSPGERKESAMNGTQRGRGYRPQLLQSMRRATQLRASLKAYMNGVCLEYRLE